MIPLSLIKMGDTIGLALQSLAVHLVRSLLTTLGVLCGVWSVITMLAINEGLSTKAEAQLARLGSRNLIVYSVKPSGESSQASGSNSRVLEYGLTHMDVAQLRDNIPGVQRAVIAHRSVKEAIAGVYTIPVTVMATEPAYMTVANLSLVPGGSRFLSHADMLRKRNVCVISANLARKLFGYTDPLGQKIRLESEPFIVVGLLQNTSVLQGGEEASAEYQLYVPYPTKNERYGEMTIQRSQGSRLYERVDLHQCILQMADEDAVLGGAPVARSLLSRKPNSDYAIRVPLEEIQLLKEQRKLWNYMFFAIAAISLIVGGIGIVNIMLASVTERTREIGVRRALGAKKRDIVIQFLVEAVTLTTLGGALGIVIGVAIVPFAVEKMLGVETVIRTATVLVPFSMALGVGLVSGLYPAYRAAQLDPITALRHE